MRAKRFSPFSFLDLGASPYHHLPSLSSSRPPPNRHFSIIITSQFHQVVGLQQSHPKSRHHRPSLSLNVALHQSTEKSNRRSFGYELEFHPCFTGLEPEKIAPTPSRRPDPSHNPNSLNATPERSSRPFHHLPLLFSFPEIRSGKKKICCCNSSQTRAPSDLWRNGATNAARSEHNLQQP